MSLPFPDKRYATIYADPPWCYRNHTSSLNGAAVAHYSTMTDEDIAALPVSDIAADNCALLLWATFPKLPEALTVIDAWGFRFITCAFVWRKTYADGSPYCGLGFYTRSGYEICLLGLKGKLSPGSHNVRQEVCAPVGRHSAKPAIVRDHIAELFPQATPRIELFCRDQWPGWDAWGNEIQKAMPLFVEELR